MLPKLNRRRAMFGLTKIHEILAWEKRKEAERDTRFVELGRYPKDSREAKLQEREIQLNRHQVRNIGHVHCYFD